MKFETTQTKEDYLYLFLFSSSKSKLAKKRRRNTLIILSGMFIVISIEAYLAGGHLFKWWEVLIIGTIFIYLYTFYQRNLYIRHYKKNVAENFKNKFGKTASVEFSDEQLITGDYAGESKLNLEQLEHIYETGTYYIIKFRTADGLVVRKEEVSDSEFRALIKRLTEKYNIPFTQELNWKFR